MENNGDGKRQRALEEVVRLCDTVLLKFFVQYDNGYPDLARRKFSNMTVNAAAEEISDGRAFSILYMDVEDEEWTDLVDTTTLDDLAKNTLPTFRLLLKDPPRNFSLRYVFDVENHRMRKLSSDFKLRFPQEKSLEALRNAFLKVSSGRFMIILPTGLGKTIVIALVPHILDAKRVLVISPNRTISEQLRKEISKVYNPNNPIGRLAGTHIDVQLYSQDPSPSLFDADVVVANIQALTEGDEKSVAPGGNDMTDNPGTLSVDVDELPASQSDTDNRANFVKRRAQTFIEKFQPDVVIVDEGHHSAAATWSGLETFCLQVVPKCRIVLLTATPKRGDGLTYNLPRTEDYKVPFFYLFTRKEAVKEKYIKDTKCVGIPMAGIDSKSPRNHVYLKALLDPAVQKLVELRTLCNNHPLRMLVHVRRNGDAKLVEDYFSKTFESRGLKAKSIISTLPSDEKYAILEKFQDTSKSLDVCIQCKMLGEGYDNNFIAVSVFIDPPLSVSRLAQFHGRALRHPGKEVDATLYPMVMKAFLFYPQTDRVQQVVNEYENGDDETQETLFAALIFKTLRSAHIMLNSLSTREAVKKLQEGFQDYHDLLDEKALNWDIYPAERVAETIFSQFIANDLKVIDFGCGPHAYFETKLEDLIRQSKSQPKAVQVVAIDVVDVEKEMHETFQNIQVDFFSGDYSDLDSNVEMNKKYPSGTFDIALFCQSLMARDSLQCALLCAAKALKATGKIVLVVDTYKLGIGKHNAYKTTHLVKWKAAFEKETGFLVTDVKIHVPHAYLTIDNIPNDRRTGIAATLDNVSFKSLLKGL